MPKKKAKTRKVNQKGNQCVHGNNVDNREVKLDVYGKRQK